MSFSMDCLEFEALLDWRLDERLDPATADMRSHADGCPACQDRLLDATLVVRGITAWRESLPASSAGLTDRIVDDVLAAGDSDQSSAAREIEVRTLTTATRLAGSARWQAALVAAGAIAALWLVCVGSNFDNPDRPHRHVAVINGA